VEITGSDFERIWKHWPLARVHQAAILWYEKNSFYCTRPSQAGVSPMEEII
jgi:hypothetical protein